MVEIIFGGDRLRNLLPIGLVVGVVSRVNDGLQDRLEAVGIGGGKVLGTRESAARMSVPDVFGKHVDKPEPFEHRALVEGVRTEVAIQIVRA